MEHLDHPYPPPPNQGWKKWRVFPFRATSSLIFGGRGSGGGGVLFHFIPSEIGILDSGTLRPSLPQIKDDKIARFFPSRDFLVDFCGGGGFLFHVIPSSSPRSALPKRQGVPPPDPYRMRNYAKQV